MKHLRWLALLGIAVTAPATEAPRPNILLIVSDDQGYGDFSCHGNPVLKTPHLDRLHNEAVRFRQFQVSPTCAPTRSALLSGRHEFKNGVTHTIHERERLTLKAVTLAEVLRSGGYATGIFGKWHLGDERERWPDRRGFDEFFIQKPQTQHRRAINVAANVRNAEAALFKRPGGAGFFHFMRIDEHPLDAFGFFAFFHHRNAVYYKKANG